MILLDTNVVSEPLRAAPDARVIEWIDLACTQAYAALMSAARAAGLAIASADGYIAAIAAANGLAVAARDTGPFKAAGATVIDPWQP